jgi:hypothetical protein
MATAAVPRFRSISTMQVWIETVLCCLAAILFWKGLLPAWNQLNTDFPNYYLVARLLREGYSLDRVYDWVWLQRIKDHWGLQQGLVGFSGLTPFSALPVLPLTFFSALIAKRIWIVLNFAMLAASAELLHRLTGLRRRQIWWVTLLAIVPLRTSFLYGQMHLSVLFLLVMAYFFFLREREIASGACIALAAALKVYPVIFFGYFLLKRRWRAAWATAFSLLAIALLTRLWMGGEVLHLYLLQQLPRSLQGELMNPYHASLASGSSLLHRLFLFEPQLNPSPLMNSPALYAILYPLWQMTMAFPLILLLRPSAPTTTDHCIEQVEWAALLLAMLTLSPLPSSYHFVVLILPVMLLLDSLLRRHETILATITVALYGSLSLIGLVRMPIASLRFWLISALYLLTLSWLWHLRSQRSALPSTRDLSLAALLGVCGFLFGVVSYHRHFVHRDLQVSSRLRSESPSYLATDPVSTTDSVLFVGMTPEGYRVLDQKNNAAVPLKTGANADQLSFTAASDDSLLVELADSNGSRIVRAADGAILVDNAESPALSPDGRTLAYIREAKGHGALRATDLFTANRDEQLTDGSYDVREIRFLRSSGTLLLAARHQGHESLYTVSPGQQLTPFFSAPGDIAAFAISPDDHRVAFTVLLHNRWQLGVFDTESRRSTLLTDNDCNVYQPAWRTAVEIVYATDCGRGYGLTALALRKLSP